MHIYRQDLDSKLDAFTKWANDFNDKLNSTENVGFTYNDINAQEIHNLLLDHNERLPLLNSIIDQYNSMLTKTSSKEAKDMEKPFKKIIDQYKV